MTPFDQQLRILLGVAADRARRESRAVAVECCETYWTCRAADEPTPEGHDRIAVVGPDETSEEAQMGIAKRIYTAYHAGQPVSRAVLAFLGGIPRPEPPTPLFGDALSGAIAAKAKADELYPPVAPPEPQPAAAAAMRRFQSRELAEALVYAASGGMALHLHRTIGDRASAPPCFVEAVDRGESIAHLFDRDEARLVATAKRLGVNVVAVERRDTARQHVDFCGGPLRAAMAEAEPWDEAAAAAISVTPECLQEIVDLTEEFRLAIAGLKAERGPKEAAATNPESAPDPQDEPAESPAVGDRVSWRSVDPPRTGTVREVIRASARARVAVIAFDDRPAERDWRRVPVSELGPAAGPGPVTTAPAPPPEWQDEAAAAAIEPMALESPERPADASAPPTPAESPAPAPVAPRAGRGRRGRVPAAGQGSLFD